MAALASCSSDPPKVDHQRVVARPSAAAPTPTVRVLAVPVQAPSTAAVVPPEPQPAAVASSTKAPAISYPPKDECSKLPGFTAFRDALFTAIRKRDAAVLVALTDPAINLDFGGGSGVEEFRKRLDATPALWSELAALEGLGCADDGGVATLPWIFSRMPDAIDPYSALLVTGTGVSLRVKPATEAKELAKLDWVLVEAVKAPESGAFREVTSGKARGFVENAKVRSVIGYRLIADRQNGEWKITAFVAGD